ncbi:hypothetical protein HanRHA438_Chr17g0794701 [Helianthus annuus]|uniref:GAF domain-containing protein n=1 Tax=Helianthus annuus TaxID=4232 RepID=A0A9K3DF56_HELAN|nr:hypothetical protein HanXRQr2_Chr17g0784121 [Helianthus annuus]KAJ0631062.1 hypothetical protein HanLR1_Chr17g0649921 [Helianthus annuus]KAJ0634943.1 hypothetical protein HanOQP8_Chr17g0645481 [Helianthus annuus]KAJ0811569.1 hypothetical protein HanPSC8_Chr17g0752141 [Helianthus annuus]KAJ0824650.1 hypothetical protein HanRHA438_Chr17g0794701 [Helianthus annuus]
MHTQVKNVLKKFDFERKSGFLQYWEYKQDGHKERLAVADQLFVANRNQRGLQEYRKNCLKEEVFVGPATKVGLAAQNGVAIQSTSHGPDQIMGHLIVPVFSYQGADKRLIGVIELTTFYPKESYEEDFNEIQSLLKVSYSSSQLYGS